MAISMYKILSNNQFFEAEKQPPKGFSSCKFTIYQRGLVRISMDSINKTFAVHLSEFPNTGIACWMQNKNNLLKNVIDCL